MNMKSTSPTAEWGGVGTPNGSSRMSGRVVAQFAALFTAILASACCWLPLLLIAFGVSGGALSAKFEAWRPVLLPVTFVLLAVAFYLTYRRPGAASAKRDAATSDDCCDPPAETTGQESCCPPERPGKRALNLKRINKIMLWAVTAFVVAFAFFPNYVGALLGSGSPQADENSLETTSWMLNIDGMTCQGCAAGIEAKVRNVPGVQEASVSYRDGRAEVTADPSVAREDLVQAVEDAGYAVETIEKKASE